MSTTPGSNQEIPGTVASALGAVVDSSFAATIVDRARKEVGAVSGIGGFVKHSAVPAGFKFLRGAFSLLASPFIGVAAGASGIPYNEIYSLASSMNVGGPSEMVEAVRKRWRALREKYPSQWDHLSPWGKVKESGKRIASSVGKFIVGAFAGIPVATENVLGVVGTVATGVVKFLDRIKGTYLEDVVNSLPFMNLVRKYSGDVEKGAKVAKNLLDYSSNAFGLLAAKIAESDPLSKLLSLSPEDREKMKAAAKNPLSRVYEDMPPEVVSAVSAVGSEFVRRLGVSEETLTNIQKMTQKLAQGDFSPFVDRVKTFIPGFKIENAKKFMEFTNTVKATFGDAVTALGSKYQAQVDFEKVTFGVKDLLGLQDLSLEGVKKALGEKGDAAFAVPFETIRAKGNNMVAAASDFVSNLLNNNLLDKEIREKIGYTMGAGNIQDAVQALVAQKAAPDFIAKIHTFQIKDVTGQVLRTLNESELTSFKNEALQQIQQVAATADSRSTVSRMEPS